MDKIERIVLCAVPTDMCNFRCSYCYISHRPAHERTQVVFNYPPEQVAKALSKERIGGTAYVNICADGETLIPEEIPKYVHALLGEGHYVDVITNGVLEKRIDELLEANPQSLGRLMFKCSFHWLEMISTNTLDAYVRNIQKLKKSGVSYTIEITPHDELIPYLDEVKQFCEEHFLSQPQITIAWNDAKNMAPLSSLSLDEFYRTWAIFESPMLDYKMTTMCVKRKEFCYAGEWSLYVNLATGQATQCYKSCKKFGNIFEDADAPLPFSAIGANCGMPHCRNSHMLLTLGLIPRHNEIVYENIRNRVCSDGTEWLSPQVKAFLQTKLEQSNQEKTLVEQKICTLKNRFTLRNIAYNLNGRRLM